jgi:DNA-binding protein Fis
MPYGDQTFSGRPCDSGSEELDLLDKISEIVHSVHTWRERYLRIMNLLDETFGKRYGTLTLLSPSKGNIAFEVVFGDPIGQYGPIQGLSSAIVEAVITRLQPMAFCRITQKPLPLPPRSPYQKDSCLLCIPILNKAGGMGVMSINPLYSDTVSFDRDIRLLRIIACMAFPDEPLPKDDPISWTESKGGPPLDTILEGKMKQMIERVDPRTESRCALLRDVVTLVEKLVITWALKRHQNVQTETARFLGINRNTLRKKMADLNIHVQRS